MKEKTFESALDVLRQQMKQYDWTYYDMPQHNGVDKYFRWPGKENEDIMVVLKGCSDELQQFHRHEYFYFMYVLDGEIDMRSSRFYNRVTLRKNDIYAGQPMAGHAAMPSDNEKTALLCLLIKPDALVKYFLPSLSASPEMLNFLLNPSTHNFSQEIIYFNTENDEQIRKLMEIIAIEYAFPQKDTQAVLRPLALACLLNISRYFAAQNITKRSKNIIADMMQYISEHIDTATLKSVADSFSYHPNYVSNLFRKETGKTFSRILLELRMERRTVLLNVAGLSVERVSYSLGYSNPSNFHKAFREYYGKSPREYIKDR